MEKKKKILIADDDIHVHEMLTVVLSSEEFEIIHAYDGQETVERVYDELPDLVVLDIMMPKKDGRDICQDLKKNPKTKDIKILMLSAKDQQFDRIVGLDPNVAKVEGAADPRRQGCCCSNLPQALDNAGDAVPSAFP